MSIFTEYRDLLQRIGELEEIEMNEPQEIEYVEKIKRLKEIQNMVSSKPIDIKCRVNDDTCDNCGA